MWSVLATAAVGALGILWGSKHPKDPFNELYYTVKDSFFGLFENKPENKENNHDKQDS